MEVAPSGGAPSVAVGLHAAETVGASIAAQVAPATASGLAAATATNPSATACGQIGAPCRAGAKTRRGVEAVETAAPPCVARSALEVARSAAASRRPADEATTSGHETFGVQPPSEAGINGEGAGNIPA